MTSKTPLPPHLIGSLVSFTDPFQTTASRFVWQLTSVGDDNFARVCEILNTLDLLSSAPAPTDVLEALRNPGFDETGKPISFHHQLQQQQQQQQQQQSEDGGAGQIREAQELLAFMLNAEFLLLELYREFGLRMNPALAHWVEVCREYDAYCKQARKASAEWELRGKVLKIRVAFVKGVLGEQGSRFANIAPRDFAAKGQDYNVDLASFKEALYEQGVYDDREFDGPESNGDGITGVSAVPSTSSSASGMGSNTHSPAPNGSTAFQDAYSQLSALLVRATTEELPANVTNSVLGHLKANPSLLTSYPIDFPSIGTLSSLVSTNPVLTRGLITLFLQDGNDSQRKDCLSTLPFLPVSLEALETVNLIVRKESRLLSKDETAHLLHSFLANAIRAAEAMASSTSMSDNYDIHLSSTGEYVLNGLGSGGGGGGGGGGGAGRRAQIRQIQLLCLFIQSLLRTGVVDVDNVFYQVQDLGVRFMYVKEARELWRSFCA